MSKSNLLAPISDVKKFVDSEGNIITPKYRKGDPRNYRLDMGKAVLNLEGLENVTKPSKEFSVLPVAFRCLEAGLFGQEKKKWCEVYFINEALHLSMFMFHGYSVENLSQATRDLFYNSDGLTQVVWNISFVEKVNKSNNAKYYIANFDFDLIDIEDLPTIKAIHQNIKEKYGHIYRSDTAESKTLFCENWSYSIESTEPTKSELEEEAERLKGLLAAFATKEEKERLELEKLETEKPDSKPKASKKPEKKKEKATA